MNKSSGLYWQQLTMGEKVIFPLENGFKAKGPKFFLHFLKKFLQFFRVLNEATSCLKQYLMVGSHPINEQLVALLSIVNIILIM